MGVSNGRVWVPVVSLLLAMGGAYLSSQVAIAEKLGSRVTREELKSVINDTREQIRREMDDIKRRVDEAKEESRETNRLLRQWMLKQR